MVEINWKPDAKALRGFGWAMLIGFGIIGALKLAGWPLEQNMIFANICFGIALIAGGSGLAGSKVALPFYYVWMAIGWVMGNIMTRILFAIFYYLLITPMGLIMRLFGRDKLLLRKKPDATTYWQDHRKYDHERDYQRQY